MGKKGAPRTAWDPARLELLKTGVPGLDEVLGGGLPALSFNLIAGGPGAGKTTLAMQLMFATATPARPGLFLTLLGETPLKMLRYQQQFEFFDMARVGKDVHFLNLSEEALGGDLDRVLERIVAEVDQLRPGVVVVDSFRSLVRNHASPGSGTALEQFVQRLALHLTTWEITSFLIGEYAEDGLHNPIVTVADGILWLSQAVDRNSVVRKLQVVKARGLEPMPGLHTIRISDRGIQVFPRIPERKSRGASDGRRISTGIEALDGMMEGGIISGSSLVLIGPTGSGKTTFALQFVAAGLRDGEPAVIAVFEEHPEIYLSRARSAGVDFRAAVRDGLLKVIYLRPLDLSVDETLEEIRLAVDELGAQRVVIDSITGFEMALAPTFREDFRESLYRLIGALTGLGVTVYSTAEIYENQSLARMTGYQISFLTDHIITQRYIEIDGSLRKALAIIKMRGSDHSTEFRAYEITSNGVMLREPLRGFDGISTGNPTRQLRSLTAGQPGLTEPESVVLETLIRHGASAPRTVGDHSGLPRAGIDSALARLMSLGLVSFDGKRYLAVAQQRAP